MRIASQQTSDQLSPHSTAYSIQPINRSHRLKLLKLLLHGAAAAAVVVAATAAAATTGAASSNTAAAAYVVAATTAAAADAAAVAAAVAAAAVCCVVQCRFLACSKSPEIRHYDGPPDSFIFSEAAYKEPGSQKQDKLKW